MIPCATHRAPDRRWRNLCRGLLRRYGGELQWDRRRRALTYVSPSMRRYPLAPFEHENSLMLSVRMLRRSGFAL